MLHRMTEIGTIETLMNAHFLVGAVAACTALSDFKSPTASLRGRQLGPSHRAEKCPS